MANMFGQMKDLYRMQREAKRMQEKMRQIKVTGQSRDGTVRLYFNGAQELENVVIDEAVLAPEHKEVLQTALKEAYKDHQKKLQKELAKDMDLGQIRSMLGGS
ncbi:MAG: YbaB/EbfC family nucleoid-associated protein [Candidatus Dojkabacteria bacterium]|jgi:DNA-binding YbaB/EbfC family protein|nr:YbaB/EbfC family nucleoid-associated protein [Candidatus Dojkabacteria bacterium]